MHGLNQAFAVVEGYLANRILVHCLVPVFTKNEDSKSPNCCALLGTRTSSNNDSKSIGAGMDILSLLLTVIITSNLHSTINYKCDNESNNGTNHSNMNKNNNASKSNSNSNSNRNRSNNNNAHDSSTNSSKCNSI